MNKESYLTLLADNLEGCFKDCKVKPETALFMQDGASCHTANIIKDYFNFVNIDYIQDWPGNSPDLNPIENLWAIMKYELRERDTTTLAKLEHEIRDIWKSLPRTLLQDLALSFPDRLREVITRKGYPTKY